MLEWVSEGGGVHPGLACWVVSHWGSVVSFLAEKHCQFQGSSPVTTLLLKGSLIQAHWCYIQACVRSLCLPGPVFMRMWLAPSFMWKVTLMKWWLMGNESELKNPVLIKGFSVLMVQCHPLLQTHFHVFGDKPGSKKPPFSKKRQRASSGYILAPG